MKVGRRGRGCFDLAAGLPLHRGRPGSRLRLAAGHLRELWRPGCHLLTSRAAQAVLGHWAGDFPGESGESLMLLAIPCIHNPRGRHHLVPLGAKGPSSKFSIVCPWTECLRPVEDGRPGGHLTPWVWGGVLGAVVKR